MVATRTTDTTRRSARPLQEAFDLAGDPEQFPAQLAEGLAVWQPLRLYIRNWTGAADSVSLDISALDPVRGMTYAEVAADALRAHHSQGMEFFHRAPAQRLPYEPLRPCEAGPSIREHSADG
jgi:hypothetical protein